MKIIEQKICPKIEIEQGKETLSISDSTDDETVVIDKSGALQLIEILKEFTGQECKRIAVDENGECLHFHTTFGRGECFDCGKKLKEFVNENG